jgi:hypothetical protein
MQEYRFDFLGLDQVHKVALPWHDGLDVVNLAKIGLECWHGIFCVAIVQVETCPSFNGRVIAIAFCVPDQGKSKQLFLCSRFYIIVKIKSRFSRWCWCWVLVLILELAFVSFC